VTSFASSTNQAEADKPQQSIGYLISFDFPSGIQYVTTRAHPVTFSGHTYQSIPIGRISFSGEGLDRRPMQIQLGVSGIDPTLLPLALANDYHGRPAKVYRGWFNDQDQLIDTPEGPLTVSMSHANIKLGRENSCVLIGDNEFARWAQAKPILNTGASHKRFWPNDLFFDLGPQQRDQIIMWGGVRVITGSGAPGSGPPVNHPLP
jgi:hypothetical protein